jgi:hypothetical protein
MLRLKKLFQLIIFALLIPVSLITIAQARSKEKAPARIIYSGNLQGEVMPCG